MTRLLVALLFCSIVATASGACPEGWHQFSTSCYAFIDAQPLGWTEAVRYCSTLHAKLVEIGSSAENNFLKNHVRSLHKNESYWIGFTDALVEGKFIWQTTQDDAVFTDWFPPNPNDARHDEDCTVLEFGYHYQWNDQQCSKKFDFICEKEIEGDLIG
uniref:Perlucin-like n=1 Tax=Crassostrea virginica TaxID=6565 RepID=A0A8B8AI18_CRAVI|nr:perlucin-like [Crassostrea virginica]